MGKADEKSKIVIERTKVNNVVSQKGGNLSTKKQCSDVFQVLKDIKNECQNRKSFYACLISDFK